MVGCDKTWRQIMDAVQHCDTDAVKRAWLQKFVTEHAAYELDTEKLRILGMAFAQIQTRYLTIEEYRDQQEFYKWKQERDALKANEPEYSFN